MGDMAEAWRDYREHKRGERDRVRDVRVREILTPAAIVKRLFGESR
jgi:hypothetical protein